MISELELLNRLKSGDRNAFREFVESYKATVYAISYRLTGNHTDADDLSQVVFIKFFKTINTFQQKVSLQSWLYKIAVNSYIDKERKKVLNIILRFKQGDQTNASYEEHIISEKAGPEQLAESKIIHHHIEKALEKLSPKEKVVFVLKHYHGHTLKEIAGQINTSEGTVKSLLFRGIKKLQAALAFYKPELGLEGDNG